MDAHACRTLVFSSSATVYGYPETVPIPESAPIQPINPYGFSKAAVEQMLADLNSSAPNTWRIASLRYFNPVGAHPSGQIGEDPLGIPNNLFPFVSQVAVGRRDQLRVFGSDWPTHDGTGVRDYIHVMDLAEGHKAALTTLLNQGPQHLTCNLGSGDGASVLDVVNAFSAASGQDIPYALVDRRPGDAAVTVADPSRAADLLQWRTKRTLTDICRDGWAWQQANPMGYRQTHDAPGDTALAGGGHSHALLLKRWAMQPERRPQQSITLVNRSSTALYSGMVPGLIAGIYQRDELAIDLRQLCDRAGVAFRGSGNHRIDTLRRTCLHLRDRPALHFDWLSLDVGAVSRPSAAGVPDQAIGSLARLSRKRRPKRSQATAGDRSGSCRPGSGPGAATPLAATSAAAATAQGTAGSSHPKVLQRARITLIDDDSDHNGPSLLCTGSQGPAWLATTGLPLDPDGRVRTDRCLRVEGHPCLFASGDCAVISASPRPASGVWAVRAGRPLAINLEAACQGQPLRPWHPQRKALQLIGSHEDAAWARWGGWRLGPSPCFGT